MKNLFNFFKKEKRNNPYMDGLTEISIDKILPANFLLYSLATALHLSEGRMKDYGSFTRNFKRKALSPEEYKFLMQLNKIWDKNQNYEE